MADAGAQQYTFHIEATSEPLNVIRKIKEAGMKVLMIHLIQIIYLIILF